MLKIFSFNPKPKAYHQPLPTHGVGVGVGVAVPSVPSLATISWMEKFNRLSTLLIVQTYLFLRIFSSLSFIFFTWFVGLNQTFQTAALFLFFMQLMNLLASTTILFHNWNSQKLHRVILYARFFVIFFVLMVYMSFVPAPYLDFGKTDSDIAYIRKKIFDQEFNALLWLTITFADMLIDITFFKKLFAYKNSTDKQLAKLKECAKKAKKIVVKKPKVDPKYEDLCEHCAKELREKEAKEMEKIPDGPPGYYDI